MLLISTHFDDGIGSAAGTLCRLKQAGATARMATVVSRGSMLAAIKHAALHLTDWRPGEPVWIREREDYRACRTLGIEHLSLGFTDALYRGSGVGPRRYPNAASLNQAPHPADADLVSAIAAQVAHILTDDDVCAAFPLAVGDHVDHQLVAMAGLKLLDEGHRVLFYRDFFYSGKTTLAQRQLASSHKALVQLDQQELDHKIAAFQCYRTQIMPLYGGLENMRAQFRLRECSEEFWIPPATLAQLSAVHRGVLSSLAGFQPAPS